MNIYLLQLVARWINVVVLTIASSTGLISYQENNTDLAIANKDSSLIVENYEIEYQTITRYNDDLGIHDKIIVTPGQTGLMYKDKNGRIIKNVRNKVDEIIEIGTIEDMSYMGRLTAYGADCIGCTGIVACQTRDGSAFNLTNGNAYNDNKYGEVRVIAAELQVLPCGSIVDFKDANGNRFTGIVLDTGAAMRNAWRNNRSIIIDIAYPAENKIDTYTRNNIRINVKRIGW